jgi:hypothetical protein
MLLKNITSPMLVFFLKSFLKYGFVFFDILSLKFVHNHNELKNIYKENPRELMKSNNLSLKYKLTTFIEVNKSNKLF